MQVNPALNSRVNLPTPVPRVSDKKSSPLPDPSDSPERGRGVLRLLQEGHFKGVADVRLRINFADEIAVLQSDANARVAQAGPAPILAATDAVINVFLSENEVAPEVEQQIQSAREAFASKLQDAFDSYAGTPGTPAQDLLNSVSTAVSEFLDLLEELVTVETPEPGEGEAAQAKTVDTTQVEGALPLGQLIEQLREALQVVIDGLQSQFDAAEVLPPLSLPPGNGRAYEKFLNILNGLYNQQSSSVDTAA